MKKGSILLFFIMTVCMAMAKSYLVTSPNGRLKAQVEVGKTLSYQLTWDDQLLVSPSTLSLKTEAGHWGVNSRLAQAKKSSHQGSFQAFAYKKAVVTDNYNQLLLRFKDGFSVVFRMYDEGMAYRFISNTQKELKIEDEEVSLHFAKDWDAFIPYVRDSGNREDQLQNSFENTYKHTKLSKLRTDRILFSPFVVEADNGVKVAVAESDVENYPGLFFLGDGQSPSLTGVSAPYPKKQVQGGYHKLQLIAKGREPYLTKSYKGQAFPWRIFCVATEDAQLLDNDMVYRLAAPNRIGDTSWIKPGKVAWEWWNNWGVYNVDFKTGINTETYKYYIDFASRNGIEYVILDEGWAVNLKADLFQIIPEIDLKGIIDYANSKNVGIILWAGYYAFERDMERVCKHFSEMGAKGFKIDFINRDDAASVDFHYRAAAMAAKYKMMVDFHGTYKPTGLNRTYPNVVNFEGVYGLEQNMWATAAKHDQPLYDVTVPFTRMLAGPMDYTQGAMLNGTKKTYHPSDVAPMSQGTRVHQLAEYVIFLSPLNMLCDSPMNYEANPECTEFIAKIPTVWDETIPLKSVIGEYVAVARRHGSTWYVGAITNWTPRDLTLDLAPLKVGGRTATAFVDGVNADKFAQDYKKKTLQIPENGQLPIHLAPGGGFAMVIR
ncbi:MAG: glycoside hydrolase family 97 protein [Prevotellaceae bacterium]|nr:glycoside hydrolase family 97 protein [Prevotellaceae bacterium]